MTEKLQELIKEIEKRGNDQYKHFESLIKLLESAQMHTILVEFLKLPKDLTDTEINLLGLILYSCNLIYGYSGESTGLSDPEYDSLKEYYEEKSGKSVPITTKIISKSELVTHKYPSLRGTLDKIYKLTEEDVLKNKSQKGIDEWVKKAENKYYEKTGEVIDLMEEEVIIMPKFDGVSGVMECDKDGNLERALTRGDTETNEAQDITHIMKEVFKTHIKDAKFPYAEKVEIMALDADLLEYNKEFNKDYKSTRSIVSSIINSDEVDERVNYLKPIPLRYSYFENGVEGDQMINPGLFDYPTLTCKLKELDKIHDYAFQHKTVQPGLRCDGAVIYFTNKKLQKVLGREDNKQKFEVAFKFTEETAYSTVTGVEFETGLFGRIIPVVRFKPVKMKGNTIEKASLGSFARFTELELCKGDRIKILYDIIPYIVYDEKDMECSRSGKDSITPPLICPDCHEQLTINEQQTILSCSNKDCPCRLKGKILNYLIKMGVDGISYATVGDFYKLGFLSSIKDIYLLKNHKNQLVEIPGYKAKKIDNMLTSIEEHREVIPSLLLGSLGIEGISKKKFAAVLDYLSFDELIEFALDKNIEIFVVIPGIKEKSAQKIIDGINENIDLIMFLKDKLDILPEPKIDADVFKVVFTKVRNEELENWIVEHGGVVDSNVTKKTNIVVVPNLSVTSGKIEDAKKNDIPIVQIDELKEYILTHF